ncbi:PAS domain-containing sensor histidine kinase [Pseudodesulfovibrio methanolicus]|uniref:histidine kinase n=1 Tax=Pseudodesulfovibrio methanolicus TaxID=3126690 RepID=A0ABZ2J365_9BACT
MVTSLGEYIRDNELWLMERILQYAKKQGYTVYTSTLVEAWRISIVGLTDAIIDALERIGEGLPEFSPHDKLSESSIAQFGIKEARLHRERGISLQMFLGLYKYYRYSFVDLARRMEASPEEILHNKHFIERTFDLIEIAFCSEWSGIELDNEILELQSANREVTNEKSKYLTLFESLGIPSFLIGKDGTVDNINNAAAKSLGYTSHSGATYYGTKKDMQELSIGKDIHEMLPWISEELDSFLLGDFAFKTFEHTEEATDGYHFYFVSLARMKDVSGKFEGGIITIEDRTNQKQMEMELAHARKLESIGQLASGIAHEINTPLQYIANNLKFLQESWQEISQLIDLSSLTEASSDETLAEDLNYVMSEVPKAILESQNGIDQVSKIVQTLKRLAHPDNHSFVHIHLGEVFENIVNITRNEWKHIAVVKINCDPQLHLIQGIMGDINQIILNLMINAAQAIQERGAGDNTSGEITLEARNNDEAVEITVQDNGCGIPESISHRVFDPFFTTKEIGKGTGQGLGIVHSLVEKNHGKIFFSSVVGEGTTFTIHFPRSNR